MLRVSIFYLTSIIVFATMAEVFCVCVCVQGTRVRITRNKIKYLKEIKKKAMAWEAKRKSPEWKITSNFILMSILLKLREKAVKLRGVEKDLRREAKIAQGERI